MDEKSNKNQERDDRIYNEIIVDAYDEEEQMTGWHAYLEDTLKFPFEASCIKTRSISPLKEKETVSVLNLVSDEETGKEIFVVIRWCDRRLGVPLSQLAPINTDAKTKQAVEDWQYWLHKN